MRISDNSAPRYHTPRVSTWNKEFFNTLSPDIQKLGYEQCRLLVREFGELVNDTYMHHRDGVELPLKLGVLVVGTCPRKKGRSGYDIVLSQKLGKIVKYQNWESDQKTAKIFYTNNHIDGNPSFANGKFWSFKAPQKKRKQFKHIYRENWAMYAEVQPWDKISHKFRKDNFKMKVKSEQLNYNPYED